MIRTWIVLVIILSIIPSCMDIERDTSIEIDELNGAGAAVGQSCNVFLLIFV